MRHRRRLNGRVVLFLSTCLEVVAALNAGNVGVGGWVPSRELVSHVLKPEVDRFGFRRRSGGGPPEIRPRSVLRYVWRKMCVCFERSSAVCWVGRLSRSRSGTPSLSAPPRYARMRAVFDGSATTATRTVPPRGASSRCNVVHDCPLCRRPLSVLCCV